MQEQGIISARAMSQIGAEPFVVDGGIFTKKTKMGWQIVDEEGHTLAVSCDASFCERIGLLSELWIMLESKSVDAYYHLSERQDDGYMMCSDEEWATVKKLFDVLRASDVAARATGA